MGRKALAANEAMKLLAQALPRRRRRRDRRSARVTVVLVHIGAIFSAAVRYLKHRTGGRLCSAALFWNG